MKEILILNKIQNRATGICSVCSANPIVIEAILALELNSERQVLIEATSNQVNQFGGYTGMNPEKFKLFVENIAYQIGFPLNRLILGGDHLGPNCWQNEPAHDAMEKAKVMLAEYVKAGFTKIHLDASMSCLDDPNPLSEIEVADRAAILCKAAEDAASCSQKLNLSYVIGTEVPVPGGEAHAINTVAVTSLESVKETIQTHQVAFERYALQDAFLRVIGIVVQPGVEFDHSNIILYDATKTKDIVSYIQNTPFVYEAHSTDYQPKRLLKALVEDHFAILKVGPALTFALREAIFGLIHIENELIKPSVRSNLLEIIESRLYENPEHWQKYYPDCIDKSSHVALYYSLSDRIRYYWTDDKISKSLEKMLLNLDKCNIPLGLIKQYFPAQFDQIMQGDLSANAPSLMRSKIQTVFKEYLYACS